MSTLTQGATTSNVNNAPPAVQELLMKTLEKANSITTTQRENVESIMKSNERCFVAKIGPEEAAEILINYNKLNRDLTGASVNHINDLAEVMKDGKWEVVNQGLGIYHDGTLADGQHRLLGLLVSGTKQEFVVTTQMSPEAVHVLDRGTPRTIAQSLHFKGVDNARDVATISKPVFSYVTQLATGDKPRVTERKVVPWIEDNILVIQRALEIGKLSTDKVTEPAMSPKQASMLILTMLLGGWTENHVQSYVASIQQGIASGPDAPNLIYSKKLQKAKYSDRRKDNLNNTHRIALGLKSASLWLTNKTVSRLDWSQTKEGLIPIEPPTTDDISEEG